MRIPVNDLSRRARTDGDAVASAILNVAASGRYVLGASVATFEREFADFCGVAHCIGVANGSDALELALRALDIGPGDDVLTVANAAMYSTLAIRAVGATPVYADVDPANLLMTATLVEKAITSRTRAIIVTHLYGRLGDIEALTELAHDVRIPLVEDCAQAHGARRGGRRAGSFGTIGCFSFYPTKNLGAIGDGGALTTSDVTLAERLRSLRQYGWEEKYVVAHAGGRNSRLDELHAAVLLARLSGLDAANSRRRAIAERYAGIRNPAIRLPGPADAGNVVHLYVVRSTERGSLRVHLAARGVETAVHYPVPDHHQPLIAPTYARTSLPVTERACGEVLSLPCFPELTADEIDQVIDGCNTWIPPTH
jgi:dTDP-4-amino-4,6-dideoxygalactose transaminase